MFGVVIANAQTFNWDKNNPEHLEDYAIYVASREGASVQDIVNTLRCESNFNWKAWNKGDPNDGSKSVAQFQDKTFYGFAKEYNLWNPDIWNPFQQINLMVYMVRDGLGSHWTCYRSLYL